MIIIALVRISHLPRATTVQDIPFELFLLQLEGCISVLMAAISAFRSLFASEGSRASRKKHNIVWTARERIWNHRKPTLGFESNTETNGLPSIPSATMTGLRTVMGGDAKPDTLRSEFDEECETFHMALKKPVTLHTRNESAGEEV